MEQAGAEAARRTVPCRRDTPREVDVHGCGRNGVGCTTCPAEEECCHLAKRVCHKKL